MLKKLYQHFLKNKYLYILIIFGAVCWSLTMVRSGLEYHFGYGFWGANGHDGIWHIALAESLSRGTLQNPVFSGSNLQNYHLGFDLLLAFLHNATKIRIDLLYFQILPPIFAMLIGILVYKFVLIWRKTKSEALWSVFFVYFSAGLGFVITFLRDGVITGESMFWSQQSVSTLVNPPFALSLIFILSGLIFLLKYQKELTVRYYILSVIAFGLLIQIKVYAGILALGGLFVAGAYLYFKEKKNDIFYIFLGSLAICLLIFLPLNKISAGVLVWQPFWFLETLMSYSDRLGWERFYSAMTTYKMGRIWLKAILAYGIAFVIFMFGNMGLRVIGFDFILKILKKKEKLNEMVVFIFSVCFGAVTIPMFFVQKGTPWNTIQFFYYFLFFFSIIAGISVNRIFKKAKLGSKYFLLLVISIFALAGVWSTLQHYLPINPQAKVSLMEIEALQFLSNQPAGVVLTYPFDSDKARKAQSNPPRPLYFYDSTAYVSAYSGKQVFLEDEVNLNIMGYDWLQRRSQALDFISNLDLTKGKSFLKDNNIKYLYLVKQNSPLVGEQLKLGAGDLGLVKIFENNESLVYMVE